MIKKIVLSAVNNNGLALQYASKRLKNKKEIIFKAIINNNNALIYISKKLKNDKLFIIKCIKNNKYIIKNLNKEFDQLKLYNYFHKLEYNNDNKIKNIIYFLDNIEYFKLLTKFKIYIINIFNNNNNNNNILLKIYNCEEALEILKDDLNIIILNIQEVNIDNKYNIEELKEELKKCFFNKTIHFIL
jgi:hypothetical protein